MTPAQFSAMLNSAGNFAAVKAQATQAQQVSQANKDSIASLDVTPAAITTLVNNAIQSESVKDTITRTAQGAISNNYVTDAKLLTLIQADSNGNIVIGSPESKGIMFGSGSKPLPIIGNATFNGNLGVKGTLGVKGATTLADVNSATLHCTSLNNGTAILTDGSWTGVTNFAATGTVKGGTFDDGAGATLKGGTLTAKTLTDSTASLTGGAWTGVNSLAASTVSTGVINGVYAINAPISDDATCGTAQCKIEITGPTGNLIRLTSAGDINVSSMDGKNKGNIDFYYGANGNGFHAWSSG